MRATVIQHLNVVKTNTLDSMPLHAFPAMACCWRVKIEQCGCGSGKKKILTLRRLSALSVGLKRQKRQFVSLDVVACAGHLVSITRHAFG
jgi:hypothetical protein